jgi:hypothetical protein
MRARLQRGTVRHGLLRTGPDPCGRLAHPAASWHDDLVEWAQAATIVSALAAFTGLQALWISRALDRVHAALDRLDSKFDHVEGVVLRDHGERIARLEAAHHD